MNTAKRLVGAAALACGLGTAQASAPPSLEEAFWVCDYIATTRGTATAPESCEDVYEAFKSASFAGDFEALVAWWQVNKAGAHARVAEIAATAPVAPAAVPVAEAGPAKPSRTARVMAATRAYFTELAAALRND